VRSVGDGIPNASTTIAIAIAIAIASLKKLSKEELVPLHLFLPVGVRDAL
jgi:hypothetical protein